MGGIVLKTLSFKKLQDLAGDITQEIDKRLLNQEPCSQIAAWLQDEKKVLLDLKPGSLKKMLERYRQTALRKKVIQQVADIQFTKSTTLIAKKVNAMEALNELVLIQQSRFQKVYMLEVATPDPDKPLRADVSVEMAALKEMLVKLGHLQLETGVLPKAGKTVRGTSVEPDGTVKEFEWSEEQEQLYRELNSVEVTDVTPA